jgi:hypothetical protein
LNKLKRERLIDSVVIVRVVAKYVSNIITLFRTIPNPAPRLTFFQSKSLSSSSRALTSALIMIGLVLLFFAGKAFYKLAGQNNRSRWGYAILGVVSYYGGLLLGGVIIALVYELALDGSVDDIDDRLLSAMAIPIGILTCWALYKFLESQWSKPKTDSYPEGVLDGDLSG